MSVRTISGRLGDARTRRSLFAILKRNVLCAMATVGPRRRAHINTAYYAYSPDLAIFFYSYPSSRHAQNLAGNSSMALAVYDSAQIWGKPDRGLQLFGTCRLVSGAGAMEGGRVYGRRFPGFTDWTNSMVEEKTSSRICAFRFDPYSATLFDERIFGGGVFVNIPLKSIRSPRKLGK